MKSRVRLTESELHRIVKESVNRIVKESNGNNTKGAFFDDDEYNDDEYNDNNAIDRESHPKKGAFFDEDEHIEKDYNALAKAYSFICKLESFLRKTVNIERMQYVETEPKTRIGEYRHIKQLIYKSSEAVMNAKRAIAIALRAMKEYGFIEHPRKWGW